MACKEFYTIALHDSHQYLPCRFRWADCQLKYLVDCNPADIQHALETLPDTLDETYERALREIKEAKWKYARRLLLCIAVASRPLQVEELAEVLAFDFDVGPIPKFCEDLRLQNPVQAVLSTCSTLVSVVKVGNSKVVQFAHFTVKEFLTFDRLAEKDDAISRYRISMIDAHALLAQACLGILLHLDKDVTRDGLKNFPLAGYAAEHWPEHARFEGVSENVAEGMQQLFDRRKSHLAVWLWMYDPTLPYWRRESSAKVPSPPRGTPLHYAAFCGLQGPVKVLVIENSEDVNSRSFDNESTPLHLALQNGYLEAARILVEHGADAAAPTKDGWSPVHYVSQQGHVELARLMLIKHGGIVEAQTKDGETPLHLASRRGHLELAQLLLEHHANIEAQNKDGERPHYLASHQGHVELARLFLEHGADVAVQNKEWETLLHLASNRNFVELARLLLKHGADVAAQTKDGKTPLCLASHQGHVELARLFLEHGADVAVQNKEGETLLHLASNRNFVELARLLLKHGADVAAQTKDGKTPLCLASHQGHVELARLFLEHGADVAVQNKEGETLLHLASNRNFVELARLLLKHGADVAAQTKDGKTPLCLASHQGHVELARLFLE